MGECLYTKFWKQQLPFIKEAISATKSMKKTIDIEELQACSRNGDRKTLRFKIQILNGVADTRTNSAIARDLRDVLNADQDIERISAGKRIVINLLQGDILNVEVH